MRALISEDSGNGKQQPGPSIRALFSRSR